jgi:TRL-like protein family
MQIIRSAAALVALAASGCVYTNVTMPLSYRSPTPSEVAGPLGEDVDGKACSHNVLFLVAWGDGGYAAAVENAKARSGAALLADLRADTEGFNILGVYQRRCTRVRGRKAALAGAP